jgi:hypothetical protein
MNSVLIWFLLIGIFLLIGFSWFGQYYFDVLGIPAVITFGPPEFVAVVQVLISGVLLMVSLFVVLSSAYGPKDKHWAYGTIGTLLGFWLHP